MTTRTPDLAEMPAATARLHELAPEQLAADREFARIVARLLRKGAEKSEPVRVAAFNSYI